MNFTAQELLFILDWAENEEEKQGLSEEEQVICDRLRRELWKVTRR